MVLVVSNSVASESVNKPRSGMSHDRLSLDIEILNDEYWWGGAVQDGSLAPFHRDSHYHGDLQACHNGNQAQPLLLSSRGRYVWCDEAFEFTFADHHLRVKSAAPIGFSDGHHTLGDAYKAASAKYFPASGRIPDPLNFVAPQYNTWIEMTYEPTQAHVLEYVNQLRARGMPPGIFMIDDNWMEDYGSWHFHPGRFPDPKAMIDHLTELGFKLMLWVCPFVSPDHYNFRLLRDRKLLVRDDKGQIAIREWWNGMSAVLDLTHPEAQAWMHQQLDELIKRYGVHGFKFDAGDPEYYHAGDQTHRSISPSGQTAMWATLGLHYASSEYRACWKNANQPLIQRLRDKHPVWGRNGLADLIPNGLAQSLLGFSFNCPDMIGGGDWAMFRDSHHKIDQEHFVRMTQCAVLFPVMQFSVAPWRVLDDKHLACVMQMVRLRQALGSEILSLAKRAARDGEPIMRPLAYVDPSGGYERVTDQFMLGSDILVAPVIEPGAVSRHVVFPAGTWQGDDGSVVSGPATMEVAAPLTRLPWYRRAQ